MEQSSFHFCMCHGFDIMLKLAIDLGLDYTPNNGSVIVYFKRHVDCVAFHELFSQLNGSQVKLTPRRLPIEEVSPKMFRTQRDCK